MIMTKTKLAMEQYAVVFLNDYLIHVTKNCDANNFAALYWVKY